MTFAVHDYGGTGPDVLLLHGGGDNLETWGELAGKLNGGRVVAYVGHYPHWDAPDEVPGRIEELACGS